MQSYLSPLVSKSNNSQRFVFFCKLSKHIFFFYGLHNVTHIYLYMKYNQLKKIERYEAIKIAMASISFPTPLPMIWRNPWEIKHGIHGPWQFSSKEGYQQLKRKTITIPVFDNRKILVFILSITESWNGWGWRGP